MPSHVGRVGNLTPAMSPPSPLYPYRPYASTALISRCVDRSVVSPPLPQPMSPMFPQRGRRTGAGAAFQPLAISPYLCDCTNQCYTAPRNRSGHSIG
jgi:hypothetical protein